MPGILRVVALQRSDRSYALQIQVDSRRWEVDPDQAGTYAACCVARALAAQQEAAVFGMLLSRGQSASKIAGVVGDLRPTRPDDDWKTDPARFIPGFSMDFGPFVSFAVDGVPLGVLTPEQLTQHALTVLRMAAAVQLSAGVYRWARVELDEEEARAVMVTLTEFWPSDIPQPT